MELTINTLENTYTRLHRILLEFQEFELIFKTI